MRALAIILLISVLTSSVAAHGDQCDVFIRPPVFGFTAAGIPVVHGDATQLAGASHVIVVAGARDSGKSYLVRSLSGAASDATSDSAAWEKAVQPGACINLVEIGAKRVVIMEVPAWDQAVDFDEAVDTPSRAVEQAFFESLFTAARPSCVLTTLRTSTTMDESWITWLAEKFPGKTAVVHNLQGVSKEKVGAQIKHRSAYFDLDSENHAQSIGTHAADGSHHVFLMENDKSKGAAIVASNAAHNKQVRDYLLNDVCGTASPMEFFPGVLQATIFGMCDGKCETLCEMGLTKSNPPAPVLSTACLSCLESKCAEGGAHAHDDHLPCDDDEESGQCSMQSEL